jgi:hypothetical protein
VQIDGKIVKAGGNLAVTKIAIDPVWYLPGIARRIGAQESVLRRVLFEETGGMFSDLVTRPDLHVFLPLSWRNYGLYHWRCRQYF